MKRDREEEFGEKLRDKESGEMKKRESVLVET